MNTAEISASIAITSAVLCIMFAGILAILAYLESVPKPTTYVVMDVVRNVETVCDTPFITFVKDSVTNIISYKCGILGEPNAIIISDE